MADMPSEKMLLTASDATTKVRICQDEDVLNEVSGRNDHIHVGSLQENKFSWRWMTRKSMSHSAPTQAMLAY